MASPNTRTQGKGLTPVPAHLIQYIHSTLTASKPLYIKPNIPKVIHKFAWVVASTPRHCIFASSTTY